MMLRLEFFPRVLSKIVAAKQSYYLSKERTNYGIFNIRFQGPSVWNSIDEDIKSSPLSLFKKKMKQQFIKDY